MGDIINKTDKIKIAHITGGGFTDNIPRVLHNQTYVEVNASSWPMPTIFTEIKKRTRLNTHEMYRTFNMGIGMVVIVSNRDVTKTIALLKKYMIRAYPIGVVRKGAKKVIIKK